MLCIILKFVEYQLTSLAFYHLSLLIILFSHSLMLAISSKHYAHFVEQGHNRQRFITVVTPLFY
jgi:nitrate reductase gamma subunit